MSAAEAPEDTFKQLSIPLKKGLPANGRSDALAARTSLITLVYLLDFDKELAYQMGGVLTGLSLKAIEGGWRAIIKRKHKGLAQVAFLEADTYSGLLEALATWVEKGMFKWYTDRYV